MCLRPGLPQYAERAIVVGRSCTTKLLQASDQALSHLCSFIDSQALGDGEKSISSEHFTVGIASFHDSVGVENEHIVGFKTYGYLHVLRAVDET